MTVDVISALLLFSFVSVITPGPNNVMLMASGANFGFMRSLPHMAGVGVGFALMVILVGIGVMVLFDQWPVSYTLLKGLSVLYLCYLAFKIATAGPQGDVAVAGKPLTFLQASLFQWVNPKAWTMAVSAISLFAPSKQYWAILLIAAAYVAVSVISTTSWVLLGQSLSRWLDRPIRLRVFNGTMAALLLASLFPVLT